VEVFSLREILSTYFCSGGKTFDRKNYNSFTFPYLQPNGADQFYDRKDTLQRVEEVWDHDDKLHVACAITTRGMGKTTALKYCVFTKKGKAAAACGRVIALEAKEVYNRLVTMCAQDKMKLVSKFWGMSMVIHLSTIFQGCNVDGISFPLDYNPASTMEYTIGTYKQWVQRMLRITVHEAVKEVIKLTNVAFQCDTPAVPVFLLDEVGVLCDDVVVDRFSQKAQCNHTVLSLVLNELGRLKFGNARIPVAIAGTADGRLDQLSEYTDFVPVYIPLRPLTKDSIVKVFANAENKNAAAQNLLALYTCGIPRLVSIARKKLKRGKAYPTVLNNFNTAVLDYYADGIKTIRKMDPDDVAKIICQTQCFWPVQPDDNACSQYTWKVLEDKGIVFPGLRDCYTVPLWVWLHELQAKPWPELDTAIQKLVPGLEIKYLALSPLQLCCLQEYVQSTGPANHLKEQGNLLEYLFPASLACRQALLGSGQPLSQAMPMTATFNECNLTYRCAQCRFDVCACFLWYGTQAAHQRETKETVSTNSV